MSKLVSETDFFAAPLTTPGNLSWSQPPATPIPGVVFAGSLAGHIVAYDEVDGTILRGFDIGRELHTREAVNTLNASLRGGRLP